MPRDLALKRFKQYLVAAKDDLSLDTEAAVNQLIYIDDPEAVDMILGIAQACQEKAGGKLVPGFGDPGAWLFQRAFHALLDMYYTTRDTAVKQRIYSSFKALMFQEPPFPDPDAQPLHRADSQIGAWKLT